MVHSLVDKVYSRRNLKLAWERVRAKLRVGGELELFHPVRLKVVRTLDELDGTRADIDDLRHNGAPF
jgi:hypothetical protein